MPIGVMDVKYCPIMVILYILRFFKYIFSKNLIISKIVKLSKYHDSTIAKIAGIIHNKLSLGELSRILLQLSFSMQKYIKIPKEITSNVMFKSIFIDFLCF